MIDTNLSVSARVARVRETIAQAARSAGRGAGDIRLIAVSKTVDPALMAQAAAAGIEDFGENLAQQIVRKQPEFPMMRWHMIGHLQTNKVKYIIGRCALVQSVDREPAAQALENRCGREGVVQPVLVQVNIGEEPQKSGVDPGGLWPLCEKVLALPHLQLQGLMTVPPLDTDPDKTRPYFARMKKLFDEMGRRCGPEAAQWLSMGMTADYAVAIGEGANMVRVGTGIFGHRSYTREEATPQWQAKV